MEPSDPVHVRRLLRPGSERRHEESEGEGEYEPDKLEPHGGLLLQTPPDLVVKFQRLDIVVVIL